MNAPVTDNLGQFGKSFQEKVFQALLTDPKWAEQLIEVFDTSYFDLKYLTYLAEKYFDYAKKYKVFPTWHLLVTIISSDLKHGNDLLLKKQIIDYLQSIKLNPNFQDLPYIKDKTLEFARKQAMKAALETAVDEIAKGNYEQCVEVVKQAVLVGTTPQVGHEFLEDFDARFTQLKRRCIPTGLPEIDDRLILDGGLGAGEMGVVVANTGVGKCTDPSTKIHIRYVGIKINGKLFKPWQRIKTKRGEIFARDICSTDELL